LRFGHAPGRNQVVVGDDLGANEPALDVAVYLARGIDRRRPPPDGPGPALVGTDGEEWHQAEELKRELDDAISTRLGDAEVGHEDLGVGRLQATDLHFDLTGEGVDRNARLAEAVSPRGGQGLGGFA